MDSVFVGHPHTAHHFQDDADLALVIGRPASNLERQASRSLHPECLSVAVDHGRRTGYAERFDLWFERTMLTCCLLVPVWVTAALVWSIYTKISTWL